MSGFSADWLALRAEADRRARNTRLAERLREIFAGRGALTVLDLGAGTGANLAATAPLLPLPQRWRLVDNDPALLACATAPAGVTAEPVVADLARGLEPLMRPRPDLVTASALLDLAGAVWLDGLVAALAEAEAVFYSVLSYDGRQAWEGAHPLDREVREAFDADQRRDKGLGPALGPDAHGALAGRLDAAGFTVLEGRSDWRLEAPRDAALIAALAAGTGAAVAPALGPAAGHWAEVRAGARTVTIGHADLLALPPACRR